MASHDRYVECRRFDFFLKISSPPLQRPPNHAPMAYTHQQARSTAVCSLSATIDTSTVHKMTIWQQNNDFLVQKYQKITIGGFELWRFQIIILMVPLDSQHYCVTQNTIASVTVPLRRLGDTGIMQKRSCRTCGDHVTRWRIPEYQDKSAWFHCTHVIASTSSFDLSLRTLQTDIVLVRYSLANFVRFSRFSRFSWVSLEMQNWCSLRIVRTKMWDHDPL